MNTHVPGRDLPELSAVMFKEATQWEGQGHRLPSHLALHIIQEVARRARQGRPHFHGSKSHGWRQTGRGGVMLGQDH